MTFKNLGMILYLFSLALFFWGSPLHAGVPLWTFSPQTPTSITVVKGRSAQVIYTVQNQSTRPNRLMMKPIPGVVQSSACELAPKGSCTLTLNINGSALTGDVVGGPELCQQGNALQCYQPNPENSLRIRSEQLTVTSSVRANGLISPVGVQTVSAGGSLTFTATPDTGFIVSRWLVDDVVVQTGGLSYQLNDIQNNHQVEVTFQTATPLNAYIANSDSDYISICPVDETDGHIIGTACTEARSNFDGPFDVTIDSVHRIIYIANRGDDTISVCQIKTDGSIDEDSCTKTNPIFSSTEAVKLNSAGTHIYSSNFGSSTVTVCSVESNGAIDEGTCYESSAVFPNAAGFSSNNPDTKCYINDFSTNKVSFCPLNSDGTINEANCTSSTAIFPGSGGLNLNFENTFLYVANYNDDTVSSCPLNQDGSIKEADCRKSAANFSQVEAVVPSPSGTLIYTANRGANTVSVCQIDADGYVNDQNCTTTTDIFQEPSGIAIL